MKHTTNKQIFKIFLVIFTLLFTGCSISNELIPSHKLHVQQGNKISKDMIKQIKIGMNKEQAKLILGSPVLENILDKNEYTYVYTEENASKNFHERKLILSFDNQGKLISIKGSGISKDNIGKFYLDTESNKSIS